MEFLLARAYALTDALETWCSDFWSLCTSTWGSAGTAVIVAISFLLFQRSYKLLRLTFQHERSGELSQVALILAEAGLQRLLAPLRAGAGPDYYASVRMRIEHEILYPRPKLGLDRVVTDDYRKKLQRWRKQMRAAYRDSTIGDRSSAGESNARALTAGDVNDAFEKITTYFVALKALGADESQLQFLCTLKISTGFVAPLHLLGGLLSRFDEDWRKIVRAFDRDVDDRVSPKWSHKVAVKRSSPSQWLNAFRMVQKFNFDCWLQWGPSIPNSEGGRGDATWTSVQYGFGDENNSIELVGERAKLSTQMQAVWEGKGHALAVPALAKGRLAHSMVFAKELREKVGAHLRSAWRLPEQEETSVDLSEGRVLMLLDDQGSGITAYATDPAARYYSAYIWVMFVATLHNSESGSLTPLHPSAEDEIRTDEPWLDLFPFFEHCNIACEQATSLMKAQLALKAVAGIARIVGLSKDPATFPLRFVFTCAIDDPGDRGEIMITSPRAPTEPATAPTIRERIAKLRENDQFQHLFEGEDPIIVLDHYREMIPEACPHSTHSLIPLVQSVYEHIESGNSSDVRSSRPRATNTPAQKAKAAVTA
jgi:hypothetical protein